MAFLYINAQSTLRNEVTNDIKQAQTYLAQLRAQINAAKTGLDGLTAKWGSLITSINTAAAAAPNDAAWQSLKADAALLVANYQALQTEANSLKTAADAVAQAGA